MKKGAKAVNEPNTLTLQIRKLRPERPCMSHVQAVPEEEVPADEAHYPVSAAGPKNGFNQE